ncbi:MAG: hypothetical protein QW267_03760 [Sulfolobales archaeon]
MRVLIPLHITGFWYVIKSYNPLFTGSLGAGLTLDPPIIAEAVDSKCRVIINDLCMMNPVVDTAGKLARLEDAKAVRIRSKVMLGNGYGLSGAVALAYLTLNMLDKSSTTLNNISALAHVAEVLNETGYGDVIAEFYGNGLVLRTSPGPPGVGSVDIVPVSRSLKVVTVLLGSLTTKEMMSRFGNLINAVGVETYKKFVEAPSIEAFAELAHMFSLRVGMLSKELDELLSTALSNSIRNGGVLGYFVKKMLLTVIVEETYVPDVADILLKKVGTPKIFNIARHGLIVM